MNKGLLFKIAVVFTALSISTNVYASIVEGNLTTGLGNAVEGVVVASPTASPIAGTYTSAQSVTLTASSSTSIHYTINGSDPTCTDTNVYSTSTPVSIKSTKTIRAISCYPNSVSSIIGSYAYSLNIVDGSTENITPSSSNTGEASLPTGATSVKLSNTTSMDVSASVDVVADGKVTVGGIEKTLASFTGGNLTTAVNLSVPISISDQTITVGKAVSMQSGMDGQAMVLTNSDLSNTSVSIPDNTTVLAPAGWDGMISPPKTGSSSGSAPSGFSIGSAVIEVGSSAGVLLFDKPVSIILTGTTGAVAYKASGSSVWKTITSYCGGGGYDSPAAPVFPGECYISNGTDTKIYTYHFTTFASLTTPSSGGSVSGGGGGSYTPAVTTISPLSAEAQKVDTNKDGKIDLLDFNKLMIDWDSTGSGIASDFDGNGTVDILDFNLLMINWTS